MNFQMKPKLLASFVGLALALALFPACVSELPSVTSWSVPTVAAKTRIERDDFKKLTSITTPKMIFAGDNAVDIYRYELSAERKDGAEINYFLILYSQRGYGQSWAFWQSAADQNGKEFKFVDESQNVYGGGIVEELVSTSLSREYLDRLTSTGIRWKIYGKNAVKEFEIAPNLVAGFLAKCDATFAGNL